MSTVLNDIRDLFSIFHDGGIVDCRGDLNKLFLSVQCNYLAELINPRYENFYIELIDITKLDFEPWMNPFELDKIEFNDHEEFLKVGLEILSAEIKDNCVLVACNQHDINLDYCGGHLMVSANIVTVYDHDINLLTIDELDSLCNLYWDKVSKANMRT